MTDRLSAGIPVRALALPVSHQALPPDHVIADRPTTGSAVLGGLGDVEIGVWEMTPGTVSDVESDEVFVVLVGRARVEFTVPQAPPIDIGPGDVVRLTAGMQTVWTVTETLRKIYLTV